MHMQSEANSRQPVCIISRNWLNGNVSIKKVITLISAKSLTFQIAFPLDNCRHKVSTYQLLSICQQLQTFHRMITSPNMYINILQLSWRMPVSWCITDFLNDSNKYSHHCFLLRNLNNYVYTCTVRLGGLPLTTKAISHQLCPLLPICIFYFNDLVVIYLPWLSGHTYSLNWRSLLI